jgi:hypothetical protein
MSTHYITKCIECDEVIADDGYTQGLVQQIQINWLTCQACKIKVVDTNDIVKDLHDYVLKLDL